jgi:ATP-binding cassette subfamily F protein uup
MEGKILEAEKEVHAMQARIADPKVMADRNAMHEACERLGDAQQRVESLYARWGDLEARQK